MWCKLRSMDLIFSWRELMELYWMEQCCLIAAECQRLHFNYVIYLSVEHSSHGRWWQLYCWGYLSNSGQRNGELAEKNSAGLAGQANRIFASTILLFSSRCLSINTDNVLLDGAHLGEWQLAYHFASCLFSLYNCNKREFFFLGQICSRTKPELLLARSEKQCSTLIFFKFKAIGFF